VGKRTVNHQKGAREFFRTRREGRSMHLDTDARRDKKRRGRFNGEKRGPERGTKPYLLGGGICTQGEKETQ